MTKLPQMQSYLLAPWYPMPESNLHWDGDKYYGKHREDLPNDAQLHCWHGWWTEEELYKYGALPPLPPKEVEQKEIEWE